MIEFLTIDQAYDALRVYLELERSGAAGSAVTTLETRMVRDEHGHSEDPALYNAFRTTVKSDPMSAADAMRCASEFVDASAGQDTALKRIADDLREAAVDETQSSPVWDSWQKAIDSL
ncbi:MAG: hypothetical protein M3R35_01160 [Candidatus Eremiobacteraeota bacterium]|nr:hypothetical protein [Candidatus Eremiobacteraeota bacterium]